MVTTVHKEHDYQLRSPLLPKKDDPGVPTIECTINPSSFQKVICDTESGVNIIAKVTYEHLYGTIPLYPTYRFVEGISKDVSIQIDDHYIPTNFLVLDMGEEEQDPPIILGRPFLNTIKAIIYIGSGSSTSTSL